MTQQVPVVDRLAASQKAVAMRRARASLKQDLKTRVRHPKDVLYEAFADTSSAAGTLRITEFLAALPAIGRKKREATLQELGISSVKRLAGLGRRQRESLLHWVQERYPISPPRPNRKNILVLAGPTAVGKGTVVKHIVQEHPDVVLSVSATTRLPRPGEIEGKDYYFVDDTEFDRLINEGEMLEWATVHGQHRYGTPRKPVDQAVAAGKIVILEIDLQGARQVREADQSATLVFLLPPSWAELKRRLLSRGTESDEEQARRLRTAIGELAAQGEFDYRIVNQKVADTAREVVELAQANVR